MKRFLIYKITNKINGMYYIGCHVTKDINDNYLGSGNNITKAIKEYGKENFVKEILFNFDNKIDMIRKEREIVNDDFVNKEENYNISLGGICNRINMVTVKDKEGNTSIIHKDNPKYLSGELVPVNKNLVTVRDRNNNIFHVNINDERYLSGELIFFKKGMKENEATKIKKSGINNSQYGKIWILNKSLRLNKKIRKEDLDVYLNEGWVKGRKYEYN